MQTIDRVFIVIPKAIDLDPYYMTWETDIYVSIVLAFQPDSKWQGFVIHNLQTSWLRIWLQSSRAFAPLCCPQMELRSMIIMIMIITINSFQSFNSINEIFSNFAQFVDHSICFVVPDSAYVLEFCISGSMNSPWVGQIPQRSMIDLIDGNIGEL